jgi:hypothetical protein
LLSRGYSGLPVWTQIGKDDAFGFSSRHNLSVANEVTERAQHQFRETNQECQPPNLS